MSSDFDVLQHRLDGVERAIKEIKDATRAIAESVAKIVVLEERHAETTRSLERAFALTEQIDGRVRSIEVELPGLREIRRWVISILLGAFGAVAAGVLALVLK